jgi:hypothetical protein
VVIDHIHVPPHIAKISFKGRGVVGPAGEDDAGIGIASGFDKAEVLDIEFSVVGFLESRHADEFSFITEGPAVIGTHKVLGVAVISTDDTVSTVAAHIKEHVDFTLGITGYDDRILAHIGEEEIVGVGDQAFMADHQPSSPENIL